MKKKFLISIFVIGIILVISLVFIFNNIKKNTTNLNKIMDKIEANGKIIDKEINNYNDNRDELVKDLNDYYIDNLINDYDNYIKILKNQETIIDKIKDSTMKLDTECEDRLYSRAYINTVCNNYKEYYETVVNVYLNDTKQINELIIQYNDIFKDTLTEYQSDKITDYIDYNKDSIYLGKEES